ncbi:MAG: UvrD-helicase domain-containing protein, partial [Acidobacteria bacterium]|nr:UvrD-helicase domain-containing protein [Acidobacteriota bacterium]
MTPSTPPETQQPARVELNPAQRAAVEHLHGPLLVVAGAGTGKTRVITERVRSLLEVLPDLRGENILAITYTDKAAAEMQQRIRRSAGKRGEGVRICTFHAFCYELLRRHDQALRILEPVDHWIFLRRRLHHLDLDIFKRLSEPGRFLNDFRDFFYRCQDELVSPEDYHRYVADLVAAFEREKKLLNAEERAERKEEIRRQQEIARAYAAAERLLREARRTTFGGSLLAGVELLESNRELREHLQERLRYILVDEFQDANIAQIRLLELLAGRHRNLMAVGDDDQAIYRFRGASYASFRKFEEMFPDCKKITLTRNYRSTARLLRVATQLIAQNGTARFDPHKKLQAVEAGGEKARLVELDDVGAEAAYVCSEIQRLREERGGYPGVAVLYRAHAHRNALVEALTRAGIPFVIRNLSILSSTLIRDLIAYLRAIHSSADNISLARLLAIPAWGLTVEMLLELLESARREKSTLAAAIEGLHPRVRDEQTRLGELLGLLADLRGRAPQRTVTQLFDDLRERLQLSLLPADPDARPLATFAGFLRQWEEEKSETKRLPELVEYLAYFEEAGGAVNLPEDTDNRNAVQLMTVHTAKGLEFDSVFVLRLNRNDFPTTRRRPLFVFPEALMKEVLPPGDFHIQEERRLCYVALTRARQRLTLTSLTGTRRAPSVFLED